MNVYVNIHFPIFIFRQLQTDAVSEGTKMCKTKKSPLKVSVDTGNSEKNVHHLKLGKYLEIY